MPKSKYKPLSFSTTMRNPERIGGFLRCLAKHNGEILTNNLIYKIVAELVKDKLYCPMYVKQQPLLRNIYNNELSTFSDAQVEEIIEHSPQKHKEVGFDEGWPSRFDTWYKLAMEFGFVYYAMNEPISISETGFMLIEATGMDDTNDAKIQSIFLNTMAKYQTNNPFRKISNDNVPLILLLEVIKKFREENQDFKGISRQELSFFICWPNSDADALYKKIKHFRQLYGVSKYTDELIYNECLDILGYGAKDKKYVKIDKVTGEAVDEYIRKMRITGVISLRGGGRFLDWNTLEQYKINYVLEHYTWYQQYSDTKQYYDYMSKIDPRLIIAEEVLDISEIDKLRQTTLTNYAENYSREYIFNELKILGSRNAESHDELFKFIPAPARFEFLTSIMLVQNFNSLKVRPNYPIDDEGIPTSTAAGGMGDIECEDDKKELVEVTLIQGRRQVEGEMLPITRHLSELQKTTSKECVALFVAPTIYPDAKRYVEWVNFNEHLRIVNFDIDKLVDDVRDSDRLSELVAL